ncbi:MAG: hypothetical protein KAV82_13575 [Phycisphaerae bacterium]|nr:hypothetical protein [Phycisphaerae bacterium]
MFLVTGTQLDYLELAQWIGLVIVGVVVLVVVLVVIRRLYRRHCDQPTKQVWSIEELREMHECGNLNEEEYALLRDRILREMGVSRPKGDSTA